MENAQFKITRERNNTVVGTFTSNLLGIIEIDNLLNDNYLIEEIVAPDGYMLLEEPIRITEQDFDTFNVVEKTIINKKVPVIPNKVSVQLDAKKLLENRTLKDQEFSFELLDSNNKRLQIAQNNRTGNIIFEPITLDEVGTYTFSIKEVKGFDKKIKYDSRIVNVTVTVEEKDNMLDATVNYENNNTFTNTYTKDPTPKTGVNDNSFHWFIVATLALVVTMIA